MAKLVKCCICNTIHHITLTEKINGKFFCFKCINDFTKEPSIGIDKPYDIC